MLSRISEITAEGGTARLTLSVRKSSSELVRRQFRVFLLRQIIEIWQIQNLIVESQFSEFSKISNALDRISS